MALYKLIPPFVSNSTILSNADESEPLSLTSELVSKQAPFGTYHFSNSGQTTWHGFAHEIFVQTHQIDQVQLAETTDYPTFAKRPAYSVMDTDKITQTLKQPIRSWQDALADVIKQL